MPTLNEMMTDIVRRHGVATENHDQQMLGEISVEYNNLLNQHHQEPTILFSLATVYLQQGNHGLAINLFRHILKEWPETGDSPQVWNNLGTAYKGEHIDDEAETCWKHAISMVDPDRSDEERELYAEYCSNVATLHINNGDPEVGLEYIKQSTELQPRNNKSWWNRSLLELELGQWEIGFEHYDYGVATGDRMNRWKDKIPYYNGQDLKGKRVIVYGEQGIGDEIMFASAIPDLIDAVTFKGNVVYECHDRLESLMKHSFPSIKIYPTRKKNPEECHTIDPSQFDYCMGVGSLFRWFGVKKRAPYLKPDIKLVDHYRHRLDELGPGLKVGIGYAAGHKKTHGHTRSFKLTTLQPILDVEGCQFVSLQYTPEATQKFSNHFMNTGRKVHHWPDVLYRGEQPGDNYEHTVALIAALDVCVLPNTTAVHVCGAVGTKCFSLTPKACAWRYRGGDKNMVMYNDHVALIRENEGWADAADLVRRLLLCHEKLQPKAGVVSIAK